jgi:hypothetical protein
MLYDMVGRILLLFTFLILKLAICFSQDINISQYPDGNNHIKTEIKNGRTYYHQIWDKDGNEVLVNGTGNHSFLDQERNITDYREIKDSLCLAWFEIRHEHSDTIYWMADKPAYFKKGVNEFYKEMNVNLRRVCDPFKIERIKKNPDLQKQVFVHFIVNKEGKITEVEVKKANNVYIKKCSAAVIWASKGWIPAISNGKNVNFQFIMPITF